MKSNICIMLIISCILFSPKIGGSVFAASNDKSPTYEETLFEIGYQSVEEALKAFEHQSKQSLKLPVKVPPLTFTHYLGRFSNLNHSFEVKFLNDKTAENHYFIRINS